ncbi:DUF1735 domain-containing protein [Aridibaculum aurantiacum]|uniref:DUF1735 domain-containing protein n=1 Tax=Aridibaculum aurantiacum TaxID=2810307 RepID=UPI001A959DC1|nr:DUF1735 domain-containing protein [Aridibaculum aurantiacum]
MKLNKLPILLVMLLSMTACRKDIRTVPEVNYEGGPMVNFNNYYDNEGRPGYKKAEIALKDTFISANIEIKLSNTTEPASQDIKIYLKKVDALVTDYNTRFGTSLTPLPNSSAAAKFDFSEPVIIKKGQRKATVPFMVNALLLNLNVINAIGIAIDRVEGAAINAGPESRLVVEFGARNKYDGRYSVTGTFVDNTNATFTAFYPLEWELVTSGEHSVIVYDNELLGFPGYVFLAAGSPTYYGNFGLEVNFDPSGNGNIVSVTNYYGQPSPNNRYAQLDPTGINKWTPTKIDIKYNMLQPTPTTVRSVFTETWTYLGPR